MAGNIFTVLSGRLHREERMIQTQTNVDRNVAEGKTGCKLHAVTWPNILNVDSSRDIATFVFCNSDDSGL